MPTGQQAKCLEILGLRPLRHLIRQAGSGRLLVPMDGFIIAHELLVIGRLRAAASMPRHQKRDESGQHFISKNNASGVRPNSNLVSARISPRDSACAAAFA